MGAGLALLVVTGVLDVFLGEGATIAEDGVDAFADAGGLLGAAVGGALARFLGRWGALTVLVVLGVLAVSLLTGRSVRQLWHLVADAARPALAGAGAWVSDLFRVGHHTADDASPEDLSPPSLYDQDADGASEKKPRRRAKKKDAPSVVVADPDPVEPEQLEIDLPPGAAGSPWRLPPGKLLAVSARRNVDTRAVEERGRTLEAALAEHGVQTRLVGMVVGPTVTRYELELGVGVKVARVTTLHKDIAYAMASPGRPHHRPHPRPPGHRGGGAQRGTPGGQPGRHPGLGGGPPGHPPAGGGRRPGHQRGLGADEPGDHAPPADRRARPVPASRAASTRSSPRS